ncbi:MAG: hypothetical protein JWM44_4231 [Bacilli bacterium]|nr:hypothetical protein [Bacilli bacterium]
MGIHEVLILRNCVVFHYYIGYKGNRITSSMSKEEAIIQLLQMSKDFRGLCILIYDDNDKLRGQIPRKKPLNES